MLRDMQREGQQEWTQVGTAIDDRINELYATKAAFHRAAKTADPENEGISPQTLKRWIEGAPIERADKRRVLCDALHWTRGSIDALLSGRPALTVESDPAGHGGSLGWPIEWENEVVKVRDDLGELRDEVLSLGQAVEKLANALMKQRGDEEQ